MTSGDSIRSARYLRRSKHKSATERASTFDTVSVEDQRTRCTRIENAYGYTHVAEFKDDGISAWKDDVQRPDFDRLCALIDAGQVDVVLADALDRLTRRGALEALLLADRCKRAGINLHTDAEGFIDTSDTQAVYKVFFPAVRAEEESAAKSRRLRNRSTERAQAGEGRNAGPRPFGWAEDRKTLDAVESALLIDAARRVLAGGGVARIVREWNDAEVATTRGKQWAVSSVKAALLRPRNAGLSVLRGDVVEGVVGQWEPLWDRETHDALVAVLGSRGGGRKPRSHLLSGILRCACGAPMRAANAGAGSKVYRCTVQTDRKRKDGREHFTIGQDVADAEAMRQLVDEILIGPEREADAPAVARLAALYARRDEIAEEVSRLVAAVRSGALTGEDVAADRAELDRESVDVAAEIDRVSAESSVAAVLLDLRRSLAGPRFDPVVTSDVRAQIRARLEEAPLEDVQALIRGHLVMTVVRSGRAGGYGADRIETKPR